MSRKLRFGESTLGFYNKGQRILLMYRAPIGANNGMLVY